MANDFLFTSESVSEGHPDKVSDQISDAILDAIFKQDPKSRVAAETLCNTGLVVLAGEITTNANVDYIQVARDTIKRIGYDNTEYGIDNLKLNIWPTGPILRKIILARFANTFAMMYSSGITILDCIANSRDLVDNQVIAQSLQNVMKEIESGKNLTQSFQQTGIFPPLVVRMLKVGEATGQLDQALLNVSYFYDRDVKDSIKKVQVMIEPMMTVILGALLGWVMLSVLSPIYDIIGKVQL
jgi:hypothetical protein